MTVRKSQIPLLLFAKAPIAGQVKTRLTSHCSAEQAAEIAEILIEASIRVAAEHWPGQVCLSVWQIEAHPFISKMCERYDVALLSQVDGDLGKKMAAAFEEVGYPAAIMGCDAPLITADTLARAHQCLIAEQNVIGPCQDGGYYLIGLSQSASSLFRGMTWGADTVLADTLSAAVRNNIKLVELAESYDIDRWQDLIQASGKIPALQNYLDSQGLSETRFTGL